ncbi:universal stress protein [Saccharopolyspora sp. K220]|uniref:universal stress protein n=1 Tax=Saccharopolyspora soli TaxID=2926618 RepID=UPI001F56F7B3|nr:universal stress protein [Saccharopolyspora soli]MCI2420015.1 universal stress protein [Saccharopolyspora soli]
MYKNILVAVDGTPVTDTVVDTVMSLAKVTLATVHALHIKPSDFLYGPVPAVVDLEDDQQAQDVVDAALARLRRAGITAEGEVLPGQQQLRADAILQYAHRLGCDLIVLGPGHHAGLGAVLHDSVSRAVVARTPVSVLLVHAGTATA